MSTSGLLSTIVQAFQNPFAPATTVTTPTGSISEKPLISLQPATRTIPVTSVKPFETENIFTETPSKTLQTSPETETPIEIPTTSLIAPTETEPSLKIEEE